MIEHQRELVLDLALNRISEIDLIQQFPIDLTTPFVNKALTEALPSRMPDDVECALLLGFHFGFHADDVVILCRLMAEEWHYSHENIAMVMQRLKDPRAIDCLYEASLKRFDYLGFDEYRALAVKCAWALHAINTDEAIEKLEMMDQSQEPVVSAIAKELLALPHE